MSNEVTIRALTLDRQVWTAGLSVGKAGTSITVFNPPKVNVRVIVNILFRSVVYTGVEMPLSIALSEAEGDATNVHQNGFLEFLGFRRPGARTRLKHKKT
jgi:hypothetical protein